MEGVGGEAGGTRPLSGDRPRMAIRIIGRSYPQRHLLPEI